MSKVALLIPLLLTMAFGLFAQEAQDYEFWEKLNGGIFNFRHGGNLRYLPGESIRLTLAVSNPTLSPILVPDFAQVRSGGISWAQKSSDLDRDPSGYRSTGHGRVPDTQPPLVTLMPGETRSVGFWSHETPPGGWDANSTWLEEAVAPGGAGEYAFFGATRLLARFTVAEPELVSAMTAPAGSVPNEWFSVAVVQEFGIYSLIISLANFGDSESPERVSDLEEVVRLLNRTSRIDIVSAVGDSQGNVRIEFRILSGPVQVISLPPSRLPAQPPSTTRHIVPLVECVSLSNGTATVDYGYFSDNSDTVTLPIGVQNRFQSGAPERGQPTIFQPGRHSKVFRVLHNESDHAGWRLLPPGANQREARWWQGSYPACRAE